MLDLSNNYTLPAYVHNVTLDRITKLASFPKFSLKEGYEEGVKALNSVLNPGTTPFDVPKYEEVKPYYEKFEKDANSTEVIEILYRDKKINDETRNELHKLNSLILEREDIEGFDEEINEYIKNIQNNSKLSKETEILCIAGANIAISSKNYWLNAFNDKENPWHFIFDESNVQSRLRLPKWLKKVLITVACDVVGGAVGGALGLILSPAGAVAGITVVGGGASAAATKFQE